MLPDYINISEKVVKSVYKINFFSQSFCVISHTPQLNIRVNMVICVAGGRHDQAEEKRNGIRRYYSQNQ